MLGLCQEKVAEALGIAFQQLQKYETGRNRISAGRLYAVAELLDVAIPFFYEGLRIGEHAEAQSNREGELTLKRETLELARNYLRIADSRTRKALFDVIAASARQGVPIRQAGRPRTRGSAGSVC